MARSSDIMVKIEGPAPSPLANGDVKSGRMIYQKFKKAIQQDCSKLQSSNLSLFTSPSGAWGSTREE